MSTPEAVVTQQTSQQTAEEPVKPAVEPGVQKRINELTWKHREAERRATAAEARAKELESKVAESTKATEPARKTLADFNFDEVAYEDYLEQRTAEKIKPLAAKEALTAVEEREQKKAQESTAAERKANWQKRATEFTKAHPDFVEVVYAESVEFTDAVAEVLADSELGPQLAYHLAQNPDELSRIARLSPAAAGRELGKLEAKLTPAKAEEEPEAKETTASAAPPIAATKAPPPAPKIEATESTTKRAWNDPKLSQEEFNKRRRDFQKRSG